MLLFGVLLTGSTQLSGLYLQSFFQQCVIHIANCSTVFIDLYLPINQENRLECVDILMEQHS